MTTDVTSRRLVYSPSASNNYATLRRIAGFCKVISWIIVILSVPTFLGTVFALFNTFGSSGNDGLAFILSFVSLLLNTIFFIIFRVTAEMIYVVLDIEANTRQTVALQERILHSS